AKLILFYKATLQCWAKVMKKPLKMYQVVMRLPSAGCSNCATSLHFLKHKYPFCVLYYCHGHVCNVRSLRKKDAGLSCVLLHVQRLLLLRSLPHDQARKALAEILTLLAPERHYRGCP